MDFRNDRHAILVGEPTGNKPIIMGSSRTLSCELRLMVHYSTKLPVTPDADPPTVEPDILAPASLADFLPAATRLGTRAASTRCSKFVCFRLHHFGATRRRNKVDRYVAARTGLSRHSPATAEVTRPCLSRGCVSWLKKTGRPGGASPPFCRNERLNSSAGIFARRR